MTVATAMDITGDVKFRKFILTDKIESGKKKTKEIVFDNAPFSDNTNILAESFKLLEKGGDKKTIIKVNPEIF
ncbi:MAG: hypothetical protein JSW01_02915, partial [Candidatus Bathyarchaeota archaeon]